MRGVMSTSIRCRLLIAGLTLVSAAGSASAGVIFSFDDLKSKPSTGRRVRFDGGDDPFAADEAMTKSVARRRQIEQSATVDASTRDLGIDKHSGQQNTGSGTARQKPWESKSKGRGQASGGGGGGGGGGGSRGRGSVAPTKPSTNTPGENDDPSGPNEGGTSGTATANLTAKSFMTSDAGVSRSSTDGSTGTNGSATASTDSAGSNATSTAGASPRSTELAGPAGPATGNSGGAVAGTNLAETSRSAPSATGSGGDSTLESLSIDLTQSARQTSTSSPSSGAGAASGFGVPGAGGEATPPIVPEPSTAALLLLGVTCAGLRRWRSAVATRKAAL